MAVQALAPNSHGHLVGDVPALFIVAIVLGLLTPHGSERAGGLYIGPAPPAPGGTG